SHDVGDGGLAVALAESCVSGMGASIDLTTDLRPEFALFHEGPSRVLISTTQPEAVEKIAAENQVECVRIGVTMKELLRIDCESVTCAGRVNRLREVWENALEQRMAPVHV